MLKLHPTKMKFPGKLIVGHDGLVYPDGTLRSYANTRLETLLKELEEQKFVEVCDEDVIKILRHNHISEGDELNPAEYRHDWESDDRSAIIVSNLKLWFDPHGKLEFVDHF